MREEFSRRFDLENGKYLSIFLGFLQEWSSLRILLSLPIFEKEPTGKVIHAR